MFKDSAIILDAIRRSFLTKSVTEALSTSVRVDFGRPSLSSSSTSSRPSRNREYHLLPGIKTTGTRTLPFYLRLLSRLRMCLSYTSTYPHALMTWCLINLGEIFTLPPSRTVTEETPIFGGDSYQSLMSSHSASPRFSHRSTSVTFIILFVSHDYKTWRTTIYHYHVNNYLLSRVCISRFSVPAIWPT
jgi:hypothetical protein